MGKLDVEQVDERGGGGGPPEELRFHGGEVRVKDAIYIEEYDFVSSIALCSAQHRVHVQR